MRTSPLRHPLAVLRTTIGLTQKDLAGLVDCSPFTIRAIELTNRGLSLSHELALKISAATGVSVGWLLDGDPAAPIVCELGLPYSKEIFELKQANAKLPARGDAFGQYFYLATIQKVHALYHGLEHTNGDLQLLTYRLNTFLDSLASDLLEAKPQFREKFHRSQDTANADELVRALEAARKRFRKGQHLESNPPEAAEPNSTPGGPSENTRPKSREKNSPSGTKGRKSE